MPRPSPHSIALLGYLLVMAGLGAGARKWHESRADAAIYTAKFRVRPAPAPTGVGTPAMIEFSTYQLGNHAVLEAGNLRVATRVRDRRHSGRTGGTTPYFGENPGGRHSSTVSLGGVGIQIVNGFVHLDGKPYPTTGPRMVVLIDEGGRVLSEQALKE